MLNLEVLQSQDPESGAGYNRKDARIVYTLDASSDMDDIRTLDQQLDALGTLALLATLPKSDDTAQTLQHLGITAELESEGIDIDNIGVSLEKLTSRKSALKTFVTGALGSVLNEWLMRSKKSYEALLELRKVAAKGDRDEQEFLDMLVSTYDKKTFDNTVKVCQSIVDKIASMKPEAFKGFEGASLNTELKVLGAGFAISGKVDHKQVQQSLATIKKHGWSSKADAFKSVSVVVDLLGNIKKISDTSDAAYTELLRLEEIDDDKSAQEIYEGIAQVGKVIGVLKQAVSRLAISAKHTLEEMDESTM